MYRNLNPKAANDIMHKIVQQFWLAKTKGNPNDSCWSIFRPLSHLVGAAKWTHIVGFGVSLAQDFWKKSTIETKDCFDA